MDVRQAIAAYAQGLFPMDDRDSADGPLPYYVADPRAIFEIDPPGLARVRRAARRSLARDPGWTLVFDEDFEAVLDGCMAPRPESPGVWITPRLGGLYRALHEGGVAHSFELRDHEGGLLGGVLAVLLGRAAMLESMYHRVPNAGNVLLVRTLERLAERGTVLCDVQLATEHTTRLGVVEIPRAEYEQRLAKALRAETSGH